MLCSVPSISWHLDKEEQEVELVKRALLGGLTLGPYPAKLLDMDTTTTAIELQPQIEAPERMARLIAHADRAMARSGWRVREVSINLHTGFARLTFLRTDGSTGRMLTILRSTWGARVVSIREVGELKPGMYRDFWDFSESAVLGRETHEGLRSALRSAAIYVGDNPATGRLGCGKEPLRLLAGALIKGGAA